MECNNIEKAYRNEEKNYSDEYINKKELEKEYKSILDKIDKNAEVVAEYEADFEAQNKAQEEAYKRKLEEEKENQYGYYDQYHEAEKALKKLVRERYEKQDVLDKIKQSERFYEKYCLSPNENYINIIHKQDKKVEDKLDRTKDAKRIADLIDENKVKTVGVFGEWGTGKSNFLELIKNELNNESKIKVVDLKATEYSDKDKIWTYFYTEMEKVALKGSCFKKKMHIVKPYIIALLKMILVFVLYFTFFALTIAFLNDLNLLKPMALLSGIKSDDYKNFTRTMLVLVGIVFTYKNIIPILEKAFDLYGFWNEHSNEYKINYKERFGYKLVVKKHIERILNSMPEYHFVFCVDELDRCNSTAVMEFLESIQLIDDCERVHIIYAVDEEVVFEAIKKAGFNNPQNYLKKYVDLRVYLDSINSMNEFTKEIAKEYKLFDEEVEKIQWALNMLSVNISIREYYHILNTLSDLRKKWIDGEVKEKLALKTITNKEALNWYNFLPIAVFYLEGNIWLNKLFRAFSNNSDLYVKVDDRIGASTMYEDFKDCPDYIKNMHLIDIINSIRFLEKTRPLFYMNEKTSNIKNFPEKKAI
ncbi:KAP family P-loop NTPase fold protein [Butyrivibrio fibrisolvens]|uniref:KAP family P-loop NTPase fold protein n=1 Tax=Butyrivibrio fibrisolvens TaxID=831 RepID=UPI000404F126|nr:P-loop NTPase fold protein [Butyrivibrio fibrisolvens]